jgi:hypothetical protein
VVVRVTGARDGASLPRAFEAHLRPETDGRFRLLGVRH